MPGTARMSEEVGKLHAVTLRRLYKSITAPSALPPLRTTELRSIERSFGLLKPWFHVQLSHAISLESGRG